jgi:putative heme-binding domain-containing protein
MFRLAVLGLLAGTAVAQPPKPKAAPKPPPKPRTEAAATPAANVKTLPGFSCELVYAVPKDTQGSWVNLCVDPKGRLIASDQYGALYRVTPSATPAAVEKLPVTLGAAQGLLWAFDSLYVVVNANPDEKAGRPYGPGLYRVAFDGDTPTTVTKLRAFQGAGGEHGCHAVMLTPDGKRLTVVCGNQTKLTECATSRVPRLWGDDHLLPRVPDGNGFMKGVLAPGGYIFNCDPDGQNAELVSVGFRNQYDAAYNRAGELFTYDADMEWDVNTPWYRPTRVCHVTSGSEWGWRNGAGKYPEHAIDNLPPVVNIGPGSPTGVCFGYGAKFPAKYQDAFFICDWSYGKLYAVHLKEHGASYTASAVEEFVTGTPLPLTDLVVNPADGAMYFAVGGRKTQSGLYKVTYTGKESVAAAAGRSEPLSASGTTTRRQLETFHKPDPKAVAAAWPHLGDRDRFVRWAARTAVEHQPVSQWADKALAETNPQAALEAILALVRASAPCPEHVKTAKPQPELRAKVLAALARLDLANLTEPQKLQLARVYQVALHRLGPPTNGERDALLTRLDGTFPTGRRLLDGELLNVLAFLQSPTAALKGMALLADAPTQEEQLEYVRALRVLTAGWTPELRADYFKWFVKAANYKGGNSFAKFLTLIKADAVNLLGESDKVALKPVLEAKPAAAAAAAAPPRTFVKKWTIDDLNKQVAPLLAGGRDFDRGRKLFAAANCFGCHRYDGEGGSTGPDLTGIAGRFGPKDLLESILDPSKEVSDQYAAVEIETLDGRKVVGRIVNLNTDRVSVLTDLLDPNGFTNIDRNNVERMVPSKLSLMPAGLLDTFTPGEAADLMAYLLSRGDRTAAAFRK